MKEGGGEMRRVLVVDQSAEIRALYRQTLARVPSVAVRYANDGAEALAEIRTYEPELVFLDVDMPDLDGIEVLSQLHADGALQRLRVVLVSTVTEDLEWAILGGPTDALRKPFSPDELLACVDWLVPAPSRITVRPGGPRRR
jgi:CheY-like chemotaxis protein